ncbi:MAG: HEAT repeat domain-containing protein [Planctomycetota bacterium]
MASCATTPKEQVVPYQQPNGLMSGEIQQRIDQVPFQHREELVQNLLWLAQTGEQTIPALLEGLRHESPKVRSSCCWVLGRLRDRRTVEDLRPLTRDKETSVRMEAARTLVVMGDLEQSPTLIEGLDSERKEVRYMCHEALKSATGHDFGYDHLAREPRDMQVAVLRWREWWGEYSGDRFFAQNYEKQHQLNNLAAPAGETMLEPASKNGATTQQPAAGQQASPPNSQPVSQPASQPATQPSSPPAANVSKTATPPAKQPASVPVNSAPPAKKASKVIELPVVEMPKTNASTGSGSK